MTKTDVYLREIGRSKSVPISSPTEPNISEEIINKWQNIMNVYARVLGVPAGLIMRIDRDHMRVFLKTDGEKNPYAVGGKDALGTGLYCETAIGENRMLHVINALEDENWRDNPDVSLNMISYLGLPIRWKDGAFFGTICFLDDRSRMYSKENVMMLELIRDAIETDLKNTQLIAELTEMAHTDVLTRMGNRRSILTYLEQEIEACGKSRVELSCIMADVDRFKPINDLYGHDTGDRVLIAFSRAIESSLSDRDRVGRLGGDEFLFILPDRGRQYAEQLIRDIEKKIARNRTLKKYGVSLSYGISELKEGQKTVRAMIRKADLRLIEAKRNGWRKKLSGRARSDG
ncbi:MAG: sensor domain-containing diguanylate cyclase [Acholeplasmataceae bacterium]